MNFTKYFLLFLTIFYKVESRVNEFGVDLNTLQLVQVLYRHGDRSPLGSFPNDLYKNISQFFPQGRGQLTEKGMDEQFDLGSLLRKRYDGFLSEYYTRQEINVVSSDTDRTLMSAEANLAGLFPPIQSKELKTESTPHKINVQLIPIHTESDNIIRMSADCPKSSQATTEFLSQSPILQQLTTENEDFMKFVTEKSGFGQFLNGLDLDNIKMFDIVTGVHDPLFVYCSHNMTLPDWVNGTVMDKLEELRGIGFAMDSGTPQLRRLKGGPLVRRFMENMKHTMGRKSQDSLYSNDHKMYMYSGHDDTIAAVMSSLDIFKPHYPHYAATLILEFHGEEQTRENFVQFFYRNSTKDVFTYLKIPGCGNPCYLWELENLLEPVIPINWEQECVVSQ